MNNIVETEKEKEKEKKRLKELEKRKELNKFSPLKKPSRMLNFSSNKNIYKGIQMFVMNALQKSSKMQNVSGKKKQQSEFDKSNSNYVSQKTITKTDNPLSAIEKEKQKDKLITDFNKCCTFKEGFKKHIDRILNLKPEVQSPISKPIKIENLNLNLNKPDKLELDNIKTNLNTKKKNIITRNQNKLRTTFYSERFFGKTTNQPRVKTEIEKKEEQMKNMSKFKKNLSNLYLPFLNENIIFQKGETEKLLNMNFYKTSYKACCEINKQTDMPNSCIRKNYRNNWKLVKQYSKDIKSVNIESGRKKTTSYNFFRKRPEINISSPNHKK